MGSCCLGISAAVCGGPAHTKRVDHEHVFLFLSRGGTVRQPVVEV